MPEEDGMTPWICALLISTAGAVGGVVNALLSDNGFIFPRREGNVLCPGVISNVFVGAVSAFISWALYGSGAGLELAASSGAPRTIITLRVSALAGALLVGVAGSKWITNEADKQLLRQSVKVAAQKTTISPEECEKLLDAPARQVLKGFEQVPG